MPCSAHASSVSRDGLQEPTSPPVDMSFAQAPEADLRSPCSCTCRTSRSYVVMASPRPHTMSYHSVAAASAMTVGPPPRQGQDLLAVGLLMVVGASAALLTIGGSRPGNELSQSPGRRSQRASTLILASEVAGIRAIAEISRRHLSSVAQLLFRRGS